MGYTDMFSVKSEDGRKKIKVISGRGENNPRWVGLALTEREKPKKGSGWDLKTRSR